MITIQGLNELSRFADKISKNTTQATRIAINSSVKWGRTRIREDISKEYNVKLARLYASDKRKGINTKNATNSNLRGEITVGHMPVQLSGFNGVRPSSEVTGYQVAFASNIKTKKQRTLRKAIKRPIGMQVQIKKGRTQVIRSAFRIGKFGQTVFARGQYAKNTFAFRHKRATTTGPDLPINGLNSTSVATMALSRSVQNKYAGAIEQYCANEFSRQIKRLMNT